VDWKWVIDNGIEGFGEVIPRTKTVKINLREHVENDEPIVDTFVHEQLHILFPDMDEDEVARTTTAIMYFLTEKQLTQIENRYMKKLKKKNARPVSK
jgi:hypothetical protein